MHDLEELVTDFVQVGAAPTSADRCRNGDYCNLRKVCLFRVAGWSKLSRASGTFKRK